MRSMTSPKVTPETTPPPGKSAVSTTDAEIERPASCKTVGNQLERKKISRRLQKKIIQIRIVPRARPSRKRCFTVIPAACSSCITKVVPSAKTVDGLMRRSTAVIFAGAYFFSTSSRRDSGSFAATTTANMSGRIPQDTNAGPHRHRGKGAIARREVFRSQRNRVGHRTPEPESGKETQDNQRL